MSLANTWAEAEARRRPAAAVLRCDVAETFGDVAERWMTLAAHGTALAFQRTTWLRSWYATLGTQGDATPLLVTLVDTRTGRDVLGLPLVSRRHGGLQRERARGGGGPEALGRGRRESGDEEDAGREPGEGCGGGEQDTADGRPSASDHSGNPITIPAT